MGNPHSRLKKLGYPKLTLPYVGRLPDSDATVVPKGYADSYSATLAVTTAYVNAQTALVAEGLTTQSYSDTQDALRITQAAVTADAANYVLATKLGVANGVASLDTNGNLTASQVPTGQMTDRTIQCVVATVATGGITLLPGQSHAVATTSAREFRLASIPCPDPGFPWRPIPLGTVSGNDSGAPQPANRSVGTGNYGLLTVMPPQGVSDIVYGIAVCTDSYYTDTYPILPYAFNGQLLSTAPAVVGALELDLFGCVATGAEYTYLGQGLSFFVLQVPSL
jgi:hypothetical protein